MFVFSATVLSKLGKGDVYVLGRKLLEPCDVEYVLFQTSTVKISHTVVLRLGIQQTSRLCFEDGVKIYVIHVHYNS